MKKGFLLFGIFALTLSINSCKKKEVEVPDKPLTLSPLTTEQQKTSLQDNGIALADKMETLMKSDEMATI